MSRSCRSFGCCLELLEEDEVDEVEELDEVEVSSDRVEVRSVRVEEAMRWLSKQWTNWKQN